MAESEVIKIQKGDQVIELTGADKEAFIAQREADNVQSQLREAEYQAKQDALQSAVIKLKALGLTETEAKIIIGIE